MTKGNYIGLDPSCSAFGIAIIDTENKWIILDQMKSGDHHDFITMCWSIANMYKEFENSYIDYIEDINTYIGQEAPISAGINAGKLNALGEYFYNHLGTYSNYERINTFHPIKLKLFHNKKGYNKKDTIAVVNNLLDYFKNELNYTINIKVSRVKKNIEITDGEADAFMYAIRMLIQNNREEEITKRLLDMYPRFDIIEPIESKYRKEN